VCEIIVHRVLSLVENNSKNSEIKSTHCRSKNKSHAVLHAQIQSTQIQIYIRLCVCVCRRRRLSHEALVGRSERARDKTLFLFVLICVCVPTSQSERFIFLLHVYSCRGPLSIFTERGVFYTTRRDTNCSTHQMYQSLFCARIEWTPNAHQPECELHLNLMRAAEAYFRSSIAAAGEGRPKVEQEYASTYFWTQKCNRLHKYPALIFCTNKYCWIWHWECQSFSVLKLELDAKMP